MSGLGELLEGIAVANEHGVEAGDGVERDPMDARHGGGGEIDARRDQKGSRWFGGAEEEAWELFRRLFKKVAAALRVGNAKFGDMVRKVDVGDERVLILAKIELEYELADSGGRTGENPKTFRDLGGRRKDLREKLLHRVDRSKKSERK
jgi:hypothetical protein